MSEGYDKKNIYCDRLREESDTLIIEDNTIYEIDLDCYECLKKKRLQNVREESR